MHALRLIRECAIPGMTAKLFDNFVRSGLRALPPEFILGLICQVMAFPASVISAAIENPASSVTRWADKPSSSPIERRIRIPVANGFIHDQPLFFIAGPGSVLKLNAVMKRLEPNLTGRLAIPFPGELGLNTGAQKLVFFEPGEINGCH